jgi:addiction module HigA family antidote
MTATETTNTFGATVKTLITDAGLSVNKLAQRTGISPATLGNIVNGKLGMSPNVAVFVAAAIGANAVDLLNLQNASRVDEAVAALDAEGQARLNFVSSLAPTAEVSE